MWAKKLASCFAVKEPQKAISPDPAAVDPKPEEPKEAPPAPSESSDPDTSGPASDGVVPEGEKHTQTFLIMLCHLITHFKWLKLTV